MLSSQNSKPLVSVIMSTYNGQKYIKEAIDSILNQTFSDFEFIIIDDGSTDQTNSIIKSYDDNRIVHIIKEINSGIADSLNRGIAVSKGDFIARMDDDDISYPERFEIQLKEFDKDLDLICCTSSAYSNNKYIDYSGCHNSLFMRMLFGNPILHPSVMIKANVLKSNLYNPNFVPSEDYELWSRLITKGKFIALKKPLLYYRHHSGSVTKNHRKKQLFLNISISSLVYDKTSLVKLEGHEIHFANFVSQNYNISSKHLKVMLSWLCKLKLSNQKKSIFNISDFNKLIDDKSKQFVKSFFMNNRNNKKFISLVLLPIKFKIFILKYYAKKIFQTSFYNNN